MNRRTFAVQSSLGLLGSMLFGCIDSNTFAFKKNQVIACIGDSITYANGNGYVELLQKYADQNHPNLNLTFLNWGKNSETITGLTEKDHPGPRPYLFERLDTLLNQTPIDIALFCYGMNCGIYGMPSQKLFDSYTIGVYSFLEKIKQKNIAAILLTPPPLVLDTVPVTVDTSKSYSYLNPYPEYETEVLQEFTRIVLNMKHVSLLEKIDIHTPLFAQQTGKYDRDPIHPNAKGHRLIADTIIAKLGL